MKRRKKHTGHRFKITAHRPPSRTALAEMEPEELVIYVRRAEKKALPTIKEMRLGPGAALVLLAQYAQMLATAEKAQRQKETTPALSRNTLHLGKTFHVASEKYRGELSNTPRPTCGKSG